MKWLDGSKISMVVFVFFAVIVLGGGSANADFTFGTPTNMGPTVNSSSRDSKPSISADGLSLFFHSDRPGGFGLRDLWVTARERTSDPWGEPVNLGPNINSSARDNGPDISADGLSLFFCSDRPGGFGDKDIWVTTRATTEDYWSTPVNIGPTVNSSAGDGGPTISDDGLSLFFTSRRPGGYGDQDLWVTTRFSIDDVWGNPVNLGPVVNSSARDAGPSVSSDGRSLFFISSRPGGFGDVDIWVTRRKTRNDPWAEPVNLGSTVNSSSGDWSAAISPEGFTLYFSSLRPGGFGMLDLWQAPIIPIVDLNGDGIVDSADMCIMVDHWGTDEPLCDIGPTPWGDGIVDVQDLIVLAEHLFEVIPPVQ